MIAVTGVGGFLGAQLALSFASDSVIGISTSVVAKNFRVYGFDAPDQISENPEVVIHCHAAVASGQTVLDAQTLYDGNVASTQKIADRFPNAKHIFISTVSVYGNNCDTITENTIVAPLSDYAKSKLEAEKIISQLEKSAIIRLSSLYGNGMKENTLIPNYTNQALKNQQIEVWGTGERRQNYIHASDVIALIHKVIAEEDWRPEIYLGTSDREHTNLEIARLIAAETGASITHKNTDASLSVKYDNRFTQNTLNWHPEINIENGIKSYLEWKKRQS